MSAEHVELHEALTPMPDLPPGPIARLDDGTVVAVGKNEVKRTSDGGANWEVLPMKVEGASAQIDHSMLAARSGTLILSFINVAERVGLDWDKETSTVPETTQLPHCVLRSTDGGRTWQDLQRLHRDWTGDARDAVQLESGRILLTSMKMIRDPGHHLVLTYYSDDDGLSWTPSNPIDLGGVGHHDGVSESTVVQLRDGRIWMLLRTNWGFFWEAVSDDGAYWRIIRPTTIPASSSPGLLTRLRSGRIMLLWNRPGPDAGGDFPVHGGDRQWSEVPSSIYRAELSGAFTEDEGVTWTPPIVVARTNDPKQPNLAYPWACEVEPGVLWLSAMQGQFRAVAGEEALFTSAASRA
jgi:hypothetical protein